MEWCLRGLRYLGRFRAPRGRGALLRLVRLFGQSPSSPDEGESGARVRLVIIRLV
jgi:hypothetical protein